MPDFNTIKEYTERKTYIQGKFKGKFVGYLDHQKSDISHETFYDIEVLSGEIRVQKDDANLRHWEIGESEEFQSEERFLTKLPGSLPLEILYNNGTIKYYRIYLNEPKLKHYILSKQLYEDDRLFGDISGDISGYITHYDVEEIHDAFRTSAFSPLPQVVKTLKQTGEAEIKGGYKRSAYFQSDGTTYMGNWVIESKRRRYSPWNLLSGFLKLLIILAFIIPILAIGWRIILVLLIFAGILRFLSFLQPFFISVGGWILRLVGVIFGFFLVLGLVNLFIYPNNNIPKKKYSINSEKEKQQSIKDPITGDSIISNYRVWQDYDNREYEGSINIRLSDMRNIMHYRNNMSIPDQDPDAYNNIISKIYDFDRRKLDLLYALFDSLKIQRKLNEMAFAEVITSCIQDIPYTLILDKDCDANNYNDQFISEYLDNGGRCEGFVRFGILSPTEFMGSMIGDCDTRTLLLFTVLNHYKFDVTMLASELYKHSVIGIHLPYDGISKTINGKRYVIWETTQQGIRPGVISPDVSDMQFWNVILISNHLSI